MIFWRTIKEFPLFVKTLRIQCLCVDTLVDVNYSGKKIDTIGKIKGLLFRTSGIAFLEKIALCKKNKIEIYDIVETAGVKFFTKHRLVDTIPFYRKVTMDNLPEDLPDRLVVETYDIEVIRELVARGKKISLFSKDLAFNGSFVNFFNFEHLFFSTNTTGGLMFPDGVVRTIYSAYKKYYLVRVLKEEKRIIFDKAKHVFFNKNHNKYSIGKILAKKIGFYPSRMCLYLDLYYTYKCRRKLNFKGKLRLVPKNYFKLKTKEEKDRWHDDRRKKRWNKTYIFFSYHQQFQFLSVLFVTYMVWRKENEGKK